QAVREHRHLPKPPPPRPAILQRTPIAPPPPPAQSSHISRFAVGLLSLIFGACGLLGVFAIGSMVIHGLDSSRGWSETEDKPSASLAGGRNVQAVAWSPDGKTIYGGNTILCAWNAATNTIMHTFSNSEDVVG